MAKTTSKKRTRKASTKKQTTKQLVLNANYAKTAAVIGTIIISIVQSLAFHKIAIKISNGAYSLSKWGTVLTAGTVILIGIVIVLLFILLISQEEE